MTSEWQGDSDLERYERAIRRIDEANASDPNQVKANGVDRPRELVYSEWLTAWVLRLNPDASLPLRLAARCQHICRWMVPRDSFEMTRSGYLRWREHLKQFHAGKAEEILREVGFGADVIARVRELNLKKQLGSDPECQTLEDALCLVTLEYQLPELVEKLDEAKLVSVLQKTWRKMSARGHEVALQLPFSAREKALVKLALSTQG